MSLNQQSDTIHVANLGDSGLIVVRNGAVLLQTEEQQFEFNFPYQLSIDMRSKEPSTTQPSEADEYEHHLQDGDIVIIATDGFTDNVHARDIPKVLGACDPSDTEDMARQLVVHASTLSQSASYVSPFALRARQTRGYFVGGKPDDITVIVAVFRRESLSFY